MMFSSEGNLDSRGTDDKFDYKTTMMLIMSVYGF